MTTKNLRDGKVALSLVLATVLIGGAVCWSLTEAWGETCYQPKTNAQVFCIDNADLLVQADLQGYNRIDFQSCGLIEDPLFCMTAYDDDDRLQFPDGSEVTPEGKTKEVEAPCWRIRRCDWSATTGYCITENGYTPYWNEDKTVDDPIDPKCPRG